MGWVIISKRGGRQSDAWEARYSLLSARGVRVVKDSMRGRQRGVVRRAAGYYCNHNLTLRLPKGNLTWSEMFNGDLNLPNPVLSTNDSIVDKRLGECIQKEKF